MSVLTSPLPKTCEALLCHLAMHYHLFAHMSALHSLLPKTKPVPSLSYVLCQSVCIAAVRCMLVSKRQSILPHVQHSSHLALAQSTTATSVLLWL